MSHLPLTTGEGTEATTRGKKLGLVLNVTAELTAIHALRQIVRLLG